MSELTDDQLDGLFRKSAEEFDPPFDPVAWRDMKTRLDANDRTTTGGAVIWKKLLRWGLPVLLVLLITGGAWYTYRRVYPVVSTSDSRTTTSAKRIINGSKQQPPEAATSPTAENEPVRTTAVGSKGPDAEGTKQPADLIASVAKPNKSANRSSKSVTPSATSSIADPAVATNPSEDAYKEVKTARNRSSVSRPDRLVKTSNRNVTKADRNRLDKISKASQKLTLNRRKVKLSRNNSGLIATNYAIIPNNSFNKRRAGKDQLLVVSDVKVSENDRTVAREKLNQ
ncbi:hypothetical protein [Spirosoma sp. KNUC1025]|uniref:hypothetical protein n=1 Tax=Spirosoma sp. KNUC1025 TaxID=2894082 RepID=UPI00386C0EC7|nr:hypothetical protein LN737_01470 [Spirosoma sp. KNUC1025]